MAKHKSHQRTMLGFAGKPGAPPGEAPPGEAPPGGAPPTKPEPAAGAKKAEAGDDPPTEPRPGSPKGTKAGAGASRPARLGGAPLGASRAGRTRIGGSSLSAGAELLKKLSSNPPAHGANAAPEDGLDWAGETGDEPTPAVEPPAAAAEAIVVSPVLDIGEPASPPEDDAAPEDLLPPGAVVRADATDELLPPGAVVQADAEGEAEAPVPSPEAPGEQPASARGSGPDLDDLFVGLPLEDAGETPAPVASVRAPSAPSSVEQPPMTKTSSAFWMVAAGAAVAIGGLIAYFLLTGASAESAPADAEPTASAIATPTAAEAPAEPSATATATASATASASASAAASASASAAPSAKKPPTARPSWWQREDIYE